MDSKIFLEQYYRAARLPICLFQNKELVYEASSQNFNLPLLLFSCMPDELPPLWYSRTPEHMLFGGLALETENLTLLIGPVLPFECSYRQADSILNNIGRTTKDRQILLDFFASIVVCDVPTLQANLHMLDLILNERQERKITLLSFSWQRFLPAQDFTPHDYEPMDDWLESSLLSCVKYGRLEELNQFLDANILKTKNLLNLPEGSSRTKKMRDYILGANMLISHAAISAGLDYGRGMQLNAYFLEQIQKANNESDLTHLFVRLIRKYTIQVRDLNRLKSGSPLIRQINSYIHAHLYEKVTPTDIAEAINRNCSYLCTCFKKETGKTISTYIQECKVQEAKRLLEYGNQSIIEISELLGFSSQSYFCSVFRKWQHTSPANFRNKVRRD